MNQLNFDVRVLRMSKKREKKVARRRRKKIRRWRWRENKEITELFDLFFPTANLWNVFSCVVSVNQMATVWPGQKVKFSSFFFFSFSFFFYSLFFVVATRTTRKDRVVLNTQSQSFKKILSIKRARGKERKKRRTTSWWIHCQRESKFR